MMSPTPWRLFYEGSGDYLILDANSVEIASVSRPDAHFMGTGPGADINEYNAHLIAALPELLEACETLLKGEFSKAMQLAGEATAKSKVEQ